ncbi:trans-aconitate methyltransferase 1 [Coemansia guatemalensis]|uniref:Trans-aconitate methyltransferase 1 n=1 Tax=Coemansia guatemalensis TaxID=2761395 RepID=A0A9W8LRJ8_9FUNG|nr:trans-aconitate methyltransferase 1 [Coemansia guatemalensis]
MATYSKPEYSADGYQASRPRYKASLVDTILTYHKKNDPTAGTDFAVDVATGTGIFARQLPPHFKRVVGTDISAMMLQSARDASTDNSIEYIEAASEDMPFLEPGSVDVITVATGAHWFDIEKFVKEARRVLKPNGTLAIFGYPGFAHFVDYPQCDKILKDYGLGDDKLGRFWDKGREVLVNGYRNYHKVLARDSWTDIQRYIYPDTIEGEPSTEVPPVLASRPVIMDFDVTWKTLQDFLLTWSTVTLYHKKYPGRENAAKSVVREMMAAAGSTDMDEQLNIQWEEILLMCHPPQAAA